MQGLAKKTNEKLEVLKTTVGVRGQGSSLSCWQRLLKVEPFGPWLIFV